MLSRSASLLLHILQLILEVPSECKLESHMLHEAAARLWQTFYNNSSRKTLYARKWTIFFKRISDLSITTTERTVEQREVFFKFLFEVLEREESSQSFVLSCFFVLTGILPMILWLTQPQAVSLVHCSAETEFYVLLFPSLFTCPEDEGSKTWMPRASSMTDLTSSSSFLQLSLKKVRWKTVRDVATYLTLATFQTSVTAGLRRWWVERQWE